MKIRGERRATTLPASMGLLMGMSAVAGLRRGQQGGFEGDLLAASAGNGEIATLLLSRDEPCREGTDETEEGGQSCCYSVLLAPH